MKRPDVLEKNLRALLRRAYVPVTPRPAFRAELKERALARFEPGASPTARPTTSLAWAVRAAAALLLVGAVAVLLGPGDAAPRTREALLARGDVALRDAPVGSWFAADAARTRLPRGGFLQIATPDAGGHAVEVDPRGRTDLASSTSFEMSAADTLHAWLGAGEVVATHAGGEAWTLETRGGAVTLRGGAVRLVDDGPDAASVEVADGDVAWIGDAGATLDLPPGSRWRLRRGAPPTRVADELVVAPIDPEKEVAATDAPPTVVTPADETEAPEETPPSVTGSARDAATDLPIERFEVAAVAFTLGGQPAYGRDPTIRRFEDPGGAFALRGLAPGTYKLFVTADGYATWRSALLVVGESATDVAPPTVAAALLRGAAIEGRVVDALSGAPIAGAFVFSQTDTPALLVPIDIAHLDAPLAPAGRTATTDAEGRFRLTSLSPGSQTLRAGKTGRAPSWVEVPDVRSGESRGGVQLELTVGGGVRGRATVAGGAPFTSVPVIAMPQDGSAADHGRPFGLGVTDEGGRFEIGDLPPGMYVAVLLVTLEPEDLDAVKTVQPVRVRAGSWSTVEFGARPTGTRLTGRVTDPSGAPLSGQMLSLSTTESAIVDQERWVASNTDPDGRFEFVDVEPGPHVLYLVDALGGRAQELATIDVPDVPDHHQELVLPAGVVAGRLVDDETGEPLRFSLVLLVPDDGRTTDAIAGKVTTDAAGAFRFRFVAPGAYRVRGVPSASGLGTVDVGVHVDVGRDVDELELRASLGAAILVTVTDDAGAPVAGATVHLVDASGRPFATAWNPITDGAGRRRIENLPAGTWSLRVARPGHRPSATTVVLGAGETAPITVKLHRLEESGPEGQGG